MGWNHQPDWFLGNERVSKKWKVQLQTIKEKISSVEEAVRDLIRKSSLKFQKLRNAFLDVVIFES